MLKKLMMLLITILMISLTTCKGCPEPIKLIEIPLPPVPSRPEWNFVNSNEDNFEEFINNNLNGYLLLSYQDGKELALYITELTKVYIPKLIKQIEYYKGEEMEVP